MHRWKSLLVGIAAAAAALAAERPLAIDRAQSRIDIAVKATADSFVGRLKVFEPSVTLNDSGHVVGARLAFHFRDVATGKDKRDAAMHKWQETDAFPDGLFVLTALEPTGAPAATAFGRLTLHGVSREVRFPVSINRDGPRYAIDGDAPLDTREFGLPIIRLLAMLKVDPVVHVRFHLQGSIETIAQAHR